MKIKYLFLPVAVAALAMGSCAKVLDTAPDGKISYDDVFADNDKTGAFLNNCYSKIPKCGYRYYFWTNWFVCTSDECFDNDADSDGSGMVPNNMYNGNISAGGTDIGNIGNGALYADAAAQSYWEAYWNAIWNCSYFISRIGTANVDSESDRQRWKAEAHVLRAYYYMLLLRLYGPTLPIEDTPYNMADDFSGLTLASITDLTDFILSDCDSAINTDALPWRITTSAEQQRVTKAVAWAIKSRVMLYAASPLYNGGNNLWDKAYEVTQDAYNAIKGAGYELYKTSKIEEYTNDQALLQNCLNIIDWSLERGWDKEFGGCFYFVDLNGRPCEQLEWDMKLWWVHNEILIATLMAYGLTGDEKYWDWFEKVHAYAFEHFHDKENGEWYGYLHRDGTVSHTQKGSMWKGPFHLPRCLMLVDSLLGMLEEGEPIAPIL